jgi:glutamyl-tRNA synthetase
MEELIEEFSLERVSKSGAKFDPEKTKWFNQQYLKKHSDDDLAKAFMSDIKERMDSGLLSSSDKRFEKYIHDYNYIKEVVKLTREKVHLTNEFWERSSFLFITPVDYDMAVISKKWNQKMNDFFAKLKDALREAASFTSADVESTIKQTAEKEGVNPGEVMQLFRVVLTGVSAGPDLVKMAELLGKDEVVARIGNALTKLNAEVKS